MHKTNLVLHLPDQIYAIRIRCIKNARWFIIENIHSQPKNARWFIIENIHSQPSKFTHNELSYRDQGDEPNNPLVSLDTPGVD